MEIYKVELERSLSKYLALEIVENVLGVDQNTYNNKLALMILKIWM